jgi:hypothetical protein
MGKRVDRRIIDRDDADIIDEFVAYRRSHCRPYCSPG